MNAMRKIIIALFVLFPLISFAQGQITRPVKKQQQTETPKTKTKEAPKTSNSESQNTTKNSVPKESSLENKKPTQGYINGHEWVDLGLPSGTKWATCNVGATYPHENGNYYAWG